MVGKEKMIHNESSLPITIVIIGFLILSYFPINTNNTVIDKFTNSQINWLLLIASILSVFCSVLDFIDYIRPASPVLEEPLKDRMRREFEEELYKNYKNKNQMIT
jgi:hypothetical protein